jgi:hypothetical protein
MQTDSKPACRSLPAETEMFDEIGHRARLDSSGVGRIKHAASCHPGTTGA